MNIALFTKFFLEPTHIAIAQVLRGLPEHCFRVFAKGFGQVPGLEIPNAMPSGDLSQKTDMSSLAADCNLVHAIYDGHVAFDAFQLSERLGLPFILSFHGGFDTNAKMWKPTVRDLTCTVAEQALAVTVVGESDLKRLWQLGVRRSVDILPVPVDFAALPSASIPQRGELVAVGRLITKKGYDSAIEAISLLPTFYHLRLVGSGPERAALWALAKRLGVDDRVEFVGYLPLPAMLQLLSRANVFIHPARVAEDGNADGTPQALLWAQALGVPVVAGDSGSIRDVVADGVTGHIIPPNDPLRLAEAIRILVEEKPNRDRVILNARTRVRECHELSSVLARWRTIYLRVATTTSIIATTNDSLSMFVAGKPTRFRSALEAGLNALGGRNIDYSLIESGGQGVIFLARPDGSEPVILKVANYQSDDPDDVWLSEHRLCREGAVLKELGLRGCSVVPQLRRMDAVGRFLIREFVAGNTINDIALSLTLEQRANLLLRFTRMCQRLFATFHKASPEPYVVRDLKPKNLIVSCLEDQRILLIDVGSARPIHHQSKSARNRARMGTRNWLFWSPELLVSQGAEADERSDLFSFGATAYYILLARAPFSNSQPDPSRVLESYLAEYRVVLAEWSAMCKASGVSPALAEFVGKCLHPDNSERPLVIPAL